MKRQSLATLAFVGLGLVIYASPALSGPSANDTCIQGYVWREAFKGDHVCVTPETRRQAAIDNRNAKARYQRGGGAYGPQTCIQGYVWREANRNDRVCVTPATRRQTAMDNQMASKRVVSSRVARPVSRSANIMCPVQQVRAEITSSIPSPWWQTPQVGSIKEARVQNIGGSYTLVCRYQAYGDAVSIMRKIPPGFSQCTPIRGGFQCR